MESFELVLTRDDLEMLRGYYFIPRDFSIELSGPGVRVDRPLVSCLGVYKEALKVGLYFSLHTFLVQLMNVYHLSSTQIAPNSWHFVIDFLVCVSCKELRLQLVCLGIVSFEGCYHR